MISVFGLMRFNDGYTIKDAKGSAANRSETNQKSQLPGSKLNLVSDRNQLGITYQRGGLELDAISQFKLTDVSAGFSAAEAGEMDVGAGLSQEGLKDIFVLTAFADTVIEPPTNGTFVKRMSLLTKRSDVDLERFRSEWFGVHSILLRRMPGILGYRQNFIIDSPPHGDRTPIHGIAELWFETRDAIDPAFRSDKGITTMTHAKEFIGEITTFIVEPLDL
ncbi:MULTISPECIES: EthD family reductase [Rhizobium/Agrobacterium group]|uniref:EthD family reductase n=1 Tax=Rhizobium/Agrobacterium group TaxID=227290 RepID=UPI001AD9879B|nr:MULTISPECIES: EthD family reductase [Rhizobium/Agrobacterium group]MBO9112651.1 EthD family reductase [Agrobacterium sp. S2/73]QXZ76145.1 EthD family reductase [Agrobacterium sp. S7/73]QYA17307.1 EthD family reductase [Rhizobium sp. AB2/73]UEQ85576.1 EthD family reductase [Rhizobium sp. AB2/73]